MVFTTFFNKKNKMNIGLLIKEIRVSKGLKQSDLVKLTNLSKSYISEIEKGLKTPRVEQLEIISDALDTPLSTMFLMAVKTDNKNVDKEAILKDLKSVVQDISKIFELNLELVDNSKKDTYKQLVITD